MSDAAHLITDSLTFIVGAIGITLAKRKSDSKMNFGYNRVEVFSAVISIIGIWILTIFILYFAIQRLKNLDEFEINTNTMLVISILGIVVNVV
jgi:cobalt-zinc-cadmium efflux system protein